MATAHPFLPKPGGSQNPSVRRRSRLFCPRQTADAAGVGDQTPPASKSTSATLAQQSHPGAVAGKGRIGLHLTEDEVVVHGTDLPIGRI